MYFKILAHMSVKPGKSRVCKVDQQAADPGKSCSSSGKSVCWQNSLFIQGHQSFSINWLDEAYPHCEG